MVVENKILKTASLTTISKVISVLATIITLPLLLKSIGKDDYGLFVLITSLTGYLGLMTFGATSTLKNKVLESYSLGDYEKTNLIISSIFSTYFLIFLLNLILFLTVTFLYPEIYFSVLTDYKVSVTTKYIFLLLILTTLINTFIGSIFINIYHGIDKLGFLAKLQAWIIIISTIFYILFLMLKPSLLGVIIFNFVKSIFIIAINYFYLKKEYVKLHIYISQKALIFFKYLKKSSYYFFIASLLTVVATSIDYIMISKFLGVNDVALFDISQKIYLVIASAFPIAYSSWPSVSRYYFNGKRNALHALFYKSIRLNILSKITFFIPAFFAYPIIIKFWLGNEYIANTEVYFLFLIIFSNNVILGICSLFFSATENQEHLILIILISVLVNVISSVFIFLYFQLGINSFLIGTIISQVIMFVLYLYKYKIIFDKIINILFLVKYMIFFGTLGGILFIIFKSIGIYEVLTFKTLFLVAFLFLIYFILIYILLLRKHEKLKIQNIFRKNKN